MYTTPYEYEKQKLDEIKPPIFVGKNTSLFLNEVVKDSFSRRM